MKTYFQRKKASSTISPSVNYNNWVGNSTLKPPNSKVIFYPNMSRYTNANLTTLNIESTLKNRKIQTKNPQQHNLPNSKFKRSFSAFRNTKGKLQSMQEGVYELGISIAQLCQQTKNSRQKVVQMNQNLVNRQIQELNLDLNEKLGKLSKIVKHSIKQSKIRTDFLKGNVHQLQLCSKVIKQRLNELDERLGVVETSCGFFTFNHKFY